MCAVAQIHGKKCLYVFFRTRNAKRCRTKSLEQSALLMSNVVHVKNAMFEVGECFVQGDWIDQVVVQSVLTKAEFTA